MTHFHWVTRSYGDTVTVREWARGVSEWSERVERAEWSRALWIKADYRGVSERVAIFHRAVSDRSIPPWYASRFDPYSFWQKKTNYIRIHSMNSLHILSLKYLKRKYPLPCLLKNRLRRRKMYDLRVKWSAVKVALNSSEKTIYMVFGRPIPLPPSS